MQASTLYLTTPKISRLRIALVGLGFAPLLIAFFANLWQRPHYQFFPLALAGAALLAWTRVKEVPRPFMPGNHLLSTLLVGLSLLLLALATLAWSPWLGMVAALLGAIGLAWYSGGGTLLRALVPSFLVVLMIVPPPLGLDGWFAQQLRAIAVKCSSRLLDLLAVTHCRSGNIIEMPGQSLLVEEACSGINSVLITMACALFYGLWRRASWVRVLLGFVAAPFYVLLGNLSRITFGGALKFRYDIDILSGWKHELVGLILFATYVLLVISMDEWLVFLSSPMRRRKHRAETAVASSNLQEASCNPEPNQAQTGNIQLSAAAVPRRPAGRWLQMAVYVCALLGVAQLYAGWYRYSHAPTVKTAQAGLRQGATFVMPQQIGAWRRLQSETPNLQKVETLGVFSQSWHYQKGNEVVSVALDYPFNGYHDVTLCYTLKGWTVSESHTIAAKTSEPSVPLVAARMHDDLGLQGALWFGTVDERGQWLAPPRLKHNLFERWKISAKPEPVTYRIQALVTGYTPLPTAEEQHLQDFFEQARLLLWRQLSEQIPGAQ